MKRTYQFMIPAVAAMLLLFSCAKETPENTWPANTSSNGSLGTFQQQIGPPIQTFTFSSTTGYYINGSSGTRITIPPNAFVDVAGNPVSGTVTFNLVEVLNKKSVICMGGFTTANGLPLVSGGEVWMSAAIGSQQLAIAPASGGLTLQIPAGANPSAQMSKFIADVISNERDFSEDTATIGIVQDTAANPGPGPSITYYYQTNSLTLGWVNCDYYMNQSNLTAFGVSLPAIFDNENTMVMISFNDYNTVTSLYYFDTLTNSFVSGYYKLPEGMDVTFIAISEINGQFYYYEHATILQENHMEALYPATCTQTFIDQKLSSL